MQQAPGTVKSSRWVFLDYQCQLADPKAELAESGAVEQMLVVDQVQPVIEVDGDAAITPRHIQLVAPGEYRPASGTLGIADHIAGTAQIAAIAEVLPGFKIEAWYGLMGPKGMPADVVALLNTEINAILRFFFASRTTYSRKV